MGAFETFFRSLTPKDSGGNSAEIVQKNRQESFNASIVESPTAVSYLGVTLEKAEMNDSPFVPHREQYADYTNDRFACELQRKIAISFLNGDPVLIEGGTSIGKTTTVRKMCSELGWEVHYINLTGATDVEDLMGRYIPNPNRKKPEDPEYIFADGKVTSGLRKEEGKIKVIIVDEFNAGASNIVIRLHEVLDALERNGTVVLSEDASESLSVSKQQTKIIALMNPPGKGYHGREPLDPAQLRRWNYQKEASELPIDAFRTRTQALFHKADLDEVTPEIGLQSRKDALLPEQLGEILGIEAILTLYQEFHIAAKALVRERKIGADQPQPFTFDDNMEPRRVRDFVARFYNGDINETFQDALRYYYANKLEDVADRDQLEELLSHVVYVPSPATSKRKGLEVGAIDEDVVDVEGRSVTFLIKPSVWKNENGRESLIMPGEERVYKGERYVFKGVVKDTDEPVWEKVEAVAEKSSSKSPESGVSLKDALEIMGKEHFFGPDALKKAFGVKVEAMTIPFNKRELREARERGEMLIFRTDKTSNGTALSAKKMHEICKPKFDASEKGEIFYDTEWYEGEDFYTNETCRAGWALVSKDMLSDSTSKNYLEQTDAIIAHLQTQVYKGGLPLIYKKAIEEFANQRSAIEELMKSDWQKATEILSSLQITQLTRQRVSEVFFDLLTVFLNTDDERILEDMYTWTATRDSGGGLVSAGGFGSDGVHVLRWGPDGASGDLGVLLSRTADQGLVT